MTSQRIYNKMKKIILISLLGLMLSALPAYAAITANSIPTQGFNPVVEKARIASRTALKLQEKNVVSNLQQRAEKEITRRLDFLNQLTTKIGNIKKLSAAQKTDLQSQIQAQIDGLNALQVKIKADTDNTTLRTDVNSIINNYYIFLFFREKVDMLVAGDKIAATTENLSQIATKLQSRINQAQTNGNDVTGLNASLSDMNAKLTDASTQVDAAQAELIPLTAQGYPGNKTTLADARTKIQTAVQDLKASYQDVVSIGQVLKSLKITNPGASASAH
jgi:hypothetical protein